MAKIKEVKEIPLSDLEIGLAQVRLRDVGKAIDELADSIRKIGLLEPIVVCESNTPGKYEIVTGQRRFLAHKELKAPTILAADLTWLFWTKRCETIAWKGTGHAEEEVQRGTDRDGAASD